MAQKYVPYYLEYSVIISVDEELYFKEKEDEDEDDEDEDEDRHIGLNIKAHTCYLLPPF